MRRVARFFLGLAFCTLVPNAYSQEASTKAIENHPFTEVKIPYARDECSFQYSNVDFCDQRHMAAINTAIRDLRPNFNGYYILLPIQEGPATWLQKSLVVIDSRTGAVYPLPIDAYSGRTHPNSYVSENAGQLSYAVDSAHLCIVGSIFEHRMVKNGKFCFDFTGDRFTGYKTIYMRE